jgi:hypothetical protein
MKRWFLLAVLVGLLPTFALAQVNTVPQVGVITNINTQKATYASVALALPPAASATDIACIAGASGKLIQVSKIRVSGSAGTLVSAPFTLVRRTAVNTGGTAATTTANWANNISKLDTNSPTASATLISYSANPTITDAAPTYLRSQYTTLPVTSAGTSIAPIMWDFANNFLDQALTLRTTAEQACINLNGVSVSSGLLHLAIEWTEQ